MKRKVPRDVGDLTQWMEKAVQPYDIISIENREAGEPPYLLQVLELARKIIRVKTYKDDEESSCSWRVQMFDIWRAGEVVSFQEELSAFPVSIARRFDPLDCMGTDAAARSRCRVWKQVESDLEGCLQLVKPEALKVNVALKDSNVPVLCLLDEMAAQGWIPAHSKQRHALGAGKVFDMRHPSVPYLQAVLASAYLWAHGAKEFHSQRSGAFYKLLLMDPAGDHEALTAKECDSKMEDLEGKDIPALAGASSMPLALAALDDDVDGDEGAVALVALEEPLPLLAVEDDVDEQSIDGDEGEDGMM